MKGPAITGANIHLNCKCNFPAFVESNSTFFLHLVQVIVEPARGLTAPQKVQQSQVHIYT